jgi:hypothetical protein
MGRCCNAINDTLVSNLPVLTSASARMLLRRACENGNVLYCELPNFIPLLTVFPSQESDVLHGECPDIIDLLVVLDLASDHGCRLDLSCQDLWNNAIEVVKYLDCQITRDLMCYDQVVERLR